MISSSRRPGGRRLRVSASRTASTMTSSRNCTAETFTATLMPSGQRMASVQAVVRHQAPSGTIRPISSATEMNSPGGTSPRTGWRQRTSASNPPMHRARKS